MSNIQTLRSIDPLLVWNTLIEWLIEWNKVCDHNIDLTAVILLQSFRNRWGNVFVWVQGTTMVTTGTVWAAAFYSAIKNLWCSATPGDSWLFPLCGQSAVDYNEAAVRLKSHKESVHHFKHFVKLKAHQSFLFLKSSASISRTADETFWVWATKSLMMPGRRNVATFSVLAAKQCVVCVFQWMLNSVTAHHCKKTFCTVF